MRCLFSRLLKKEKYTHWLPPESEMTLRSHHDKTALGSTRQVDYVAFTTLVHGTHLSAAQGILTQDSIVKRELNDFSILNKKISNVWLAPDAQANPSFGAIVFRFDASSLLAAKAFQFYWVEMVDYRRTQAASRILVTTESPNPEWKLAKFNPRFRGGPWYYDEEKNQHYALRKTRTIDGENDRCACFVVLC